MSDITVTIDDESMNGSIHICGIKPNNTLSIDEAIELFNQLGKTMQEYAVDNDEWDSKLTPVQKEMAYKFARIDYGYC